MNIHVTINREKYATFGSYVPQCVASNVFYFVQKAFPMADVQVITHNGPDTVKLSEFPSAAAARPDVEKAIRAAKRDFNDFIEMFNNTINGAVYGLELMLRRDGLYNTANMANNALRQGRITVCEERFYPDVVEKTGSNLYFTNINQRYVAMLACNDDNTGGDIPLNLTIYSQPIAYAHAVHIITRLARSNTQNERNALVIAKVSSHLLPQFDLK